MIAVVLFWSSLFAIIFFLLGTIFKALTAVFYGLLDSVVTTIAYAILGGFGVAVLYVLYLIAEGIRTDGIGSVIGTIIMFVIVIGLVFGLIGGLGVALLEIAYNIAVTLLVALEFVLLKGSEGCEKAYMFFLQKIVSRIDKVEEK